MAEFGVVVVNIFHGVRQRLAGRHSWPWSRSPARVPWSAPLHYCPKAQMHCQRISDRVWTESDREFPWKATEFESRRKYVWPERAREGLRGFWLWFEVNGAVIVALAPERYSRSLLFLLGAPFWLTYIYRLNTKIIFEPITEASRTSLSANNT